MSRTSTKLGLFIKLHTTFVRGCNNTAKGHFVFSFVFFPFSLLRHGRPHFSSNLLTSNIRDDGLMRRSMTALSLFRANDSYDWIS